MPRLTHLSTTVPNKVWVRHLMVGTCATCLTVAGIATRATIVFGQASPAPEEVNLNAAPVVVNGRISRPTLTPGSQGEAVIELQSVLTLLGYYSGPLSGVYQNSTQAAVQQFQTDAGISPDGIVGPATWSSLFPNPPAEANPPGSENLAASQTGNTNPSTPTTIAPAGSDGDANVNAATSSSTASSSASANLPTLRIGDRGESVRRLQERLKSLGFYGGPVDGIFGAQTESAVKQAQTENNLTVDGIVGPATWGALGQ